MLQDRTGLNQNRPAKYEDVRNEIFSYLETKQDIQKPTPMDVGPWDYDKGGKGKDVYSGYSGGQKG